VNFRTPSNNSLTYNTKSYDLYKQSEQTLLSVLGLLSLKLKHSLTFVKKFSDTQTSNRIDAEYFQPMYEEVENLLSKRQRVTLDSVCSLINYGTVPTSPYCDKGTPYIKGLNLIDGYVCGDFDKIENTHDLPKRFYVKENDIIVSQMGTVGKAGIVTKNEEGYLFASFTIRVRLRDHNFIDPSVLTLYINKVAKDWYLLRKIAQASVRQNTDLPTVKGLMVPQIDRRIQQKIKEDLLKSRKNRLDSMRLLDIAKRGVEMAIEKNEKDAENWIDVELKKDGYKTDNNYIK
jgi:hypothetical protein